jgi:uncharacterized protein (TIGR00297 family)
VKFSPIELLVATGLAGLIAIASYRLRLLDRGGAWVALLVGTTIFYGGGLSASVILILFFVSSSFLTRLPPPTNGPAHDDAKQPRNGLQALANGGAPALAMLVLVIRADLREEASAFGLGALACATADTWATELGTRYGGTVYNILTLKQTEHGTSGGVTVVGLGASLAGALFIALLSRISLPYSYLCELQLSPALLITTVAGLAGSVIDSLLGATIQARYQCVICGEIREVSRHCNAAGRRVHGLSGVSNDVVNAVSSTWAGLLALGLLGLFR